MLNSRIREIISSKTHNEPYVIVIPDILDINDKIRPQTPKFYISKEGNNYQSNSINKGILTTEVTEQNAKDVMKTLSYHIPEIIFRNIYNFDFIRYTKFDKKTEHNLTPDFITEDFVLDFKVRFNNELNSFDLDNIKSKTKKYNVFGKPVIIIVVLMCSKLTDLMMIHPGDLSVIWTVFKSIIALQGLTNISFIKAHKLPHLQVLLKYLDIESMLSDELRSELKEQKLANTKGLNMWIYDILDEYNHMERFLDDNMLDQMEFKDRVFTPYTDKYARLGPSVQFKSLYNRDENRHFTIDMGKRNDISKGHKATTLVDFPIFKSNEGEYDPIFMVEELNKIMLSEDSCVHFILHAFRMYFEYSKEMDSVMDISKHIAFLMSTKKVYEEDPNGQLTVTNIQKQLEKANRKQMVLLSEINERANNKMLEIVPGGYMVFKGLYRSLFNYSSKIQFGTNANDIVIEKKTFLGKCWETLYNTRIEGDQKTGLYVNKQLDTGINLRTNYRTKTNVDIRDSNHNKVFLSLPRFTDIELEYLSKLDLHDANNIGANKFQHTKKYRDINTETDEPIINWMDDISTDFESLMNNIWDKAPTDKMSAFEIGDIYKSNECLNNQAKDFLKASKSRIDKILSDKKSRFIFGQAKGYTAITMNDKRQSTTSGFVEKFRINRVRGHNVFVLSSIAPNKITSGVVYVLSFNKKGLIVPDFIHKTIVYNTDESTLDIWLTGPFRVNRVIGDKAVQHYGNYISDILLLESLNSTIHHTNLFHSLFLSYSRPLAAVADLVYIAYKNVFSFFTFGYHEFTDKYKNIIVKDPRVGVIMSRLFNNYNKMVETVRVKSVHANFNFDFIDPIFNVNHNCVQSFLTVTYIKQLFQKQDGFDEKQKAYSFFQSEISQNDNVNKSPFHPNLYKLGRISVTNFIKLILKDYTVHDNKWESFSYHPEILYKSIELILKEAIVTNPNLKSGKLYKQDYAFDDGSNKKVLMPSNLTSVEQRYDSGVQKPPMYPAIASTNLSEALVIEEMRAREFLKLDMNKDDDDMTKVFPSKLYHDILQEPLRTIDLMCFELLVYPKKAIVILVVKEQTGYEKRIFFVQTINKRNLHCVLESGFFKILKYVKEDMIAKPGDEKMIAIENTMFKVSEGTSNYTVWTLDQTKFGDEYPLYALMINYIVMKDLDIINDGEMKLGIFSCESRIGRLEIMPTASLKLVNNNNKLRQFIDQHGEFHPFVKSINEHPELLDNLRIKQIFDDGFNSSFTDPHRSLLRGLIKDTGFILGVENAGSSMGTAAYIRMVKFFVNDFLNLGIDIDGHGHSDDSYLIFGLRITRYINYKSFSVTRTLIPTKSGSFTFIEMIKSRIEIRVKNANASFDITFLDQNNEIVEVNGLDNKYLVKLIATFIFWAPRFVGQRTSLAKTMFSTVGEVLQGYIINNRMITPIIRYSASLFSDTDCKSPDDELVNLAGRLTNLMNHGGTLDLLSDLMVWMNIFVYYRFGVKSKCALDNNINCLPFTDKERWLIPTEIGGFWYSFPSYLHDYGFKSNEIRLQSNIENDPWLKAITLTLINTNEIWTDSHPKDSEDVHIQELLSENDSLISENNNITKSDVLGMFEIRKHFPIKFARYFKTIKSFFSVYSRIDKAINFTEYFERKIGDLPRDVSKRIIEIGKHIELQDILNIPDVYVKAYRFLRRYLTPSFQESYMRVSTSIKIVNMFGWLNRLITWPYTDEATKDLIQRGFERKASITIREVICMLKEIGDSFKPIHSKVAKDITMLFRNIYAKELLQISTRSRVIAQLIPVYHDVDFVLKWHKIYTPLEQGFFNYKFKDVFVRVLEKYCSKYSEFQSPSSSLLYTKYPYLRYQNNGDFENITDNMFNLFVVSGFDINDLVNHATILERLFTRAGNSKICRIPRSHDITAGIEEHQYSRNVKVIYQGNTPENQFSILGQHSYIPSYKELTSMVGHLLWLHRLYDNYNIRNIKLEQKLLQFRGVRGTLSELIDFINKANSDESIPTLTYFDSVKKRLNHFNLMLCNIYLDVYTNKVRSDHFVFFTNFTPHDERYIYKVNGICVSDANFVVVVCIKGKDDKNKTIGFKIFTNIDNIGKILIYSNLCCMMFNTNNDHFSASRICIGRDEYDYSSFGQNIAVHAGGSLAIKYLDTKLLRTISKKCVFSSFDNILEVFYIPLFIKQIQKADKHDKVLTHLEKEFKISIFQSYKISDNNLYKFENIFQNISTNNFENIMLIDNWSLKPYPDHIYINDEKITRSNHTLSSVDWKTHNKDIYQIMYKILNLYRIETTHISATSVNELKCVEIKFKSILGFDADDIKYFFDIIFSFLENTAKVVDFIENNADSIPNMESSTIHMKLLELDELGLYQTENILNYIGVSMFDIVYLLIPNKINLSLPFLLQIHKKLFDFIVEDCCINKRSFNIFIHNIKKFVLFQKLDIINSRGFFDFKSYSSGIDLHITNIQSGVFRQNFIMLQFLKITQSMNSYNMPVRPSLIMPDKRLDSYCHISNLYIILKFQNEPNLAVIDLLKKFGLVSMTGISYEALDLITYISNNNRILDYFLLLKTNPTF